MPTPRTDVAAMLRDAPKPSGDFRDAVIARSLDIVHEHPDIEPEDIGRSLCLPTDPDPKYLERAYAVVQTWPSLARVIVMVFAAVVYGMCVLVLPRFLPRDVIASQRFAMLTSYSYWSVLIAVVFSTLCIFASPWLTGWRCMQLFPRRSFCPFRPNPALRAHPVNVEDLRTADKQKLVTEDNGVLVYDPDNHRIIIEGLRCRYIIHAADLDAVVYLPQGYFNSIFNQPTVMFTYKIAGRPLELMLYLPGVLCRLFGPLRQARADEFCRDVKSTLGIEASLSSGA
jgi:hypothetical protein